MPIPQSAIDAIKWIDRCDSSGDWGSVRQFASSVDAVIVGAHQATLPQEVKLLSTAIYTAAVEETSSSSPSNLVVVTPAGRDALVALSMYATTDDSVEALAKTQLYFVTIPRAEVLLTPHVRDALVALAKYVTAPMSVGYVSSAIGCLARRRAAPLFAFTSISAATSARDALVKMAPFATTPGSVQSLSFSMTTVMEALSGEGCRGAPQGSLADEFVTPAVIDAIIAMSQFASTSSAVLSLLTSFGRATNIFLGLGRVPMGASPAPFRRERQGVIANRRVCDAIISLAKFATTSQVILHLVSTFYVLITHLDSCSTLFANEAFRDAFVTMAPHAVTPTASYMLTETMLAIVARVPQCVEVFASGEVLRGCWHLHRCTNDCEDIEPRASVDRLVHCICWENRVSLPNEERLTMMRRVQADVVASPSHQIPPHSPHQVHVGPPTPCTPHLGDQSEGRALFPRHFADVVADLMYTVTPTLPLRRAPKAATRSSGGCRQGVAYAPLAVTFDMAYSLLKDLAPLQATVDVAYPVHFHCFINDSTMIAIDLNQLQAAHSRLRTCFEQHQHQHAQHQRPIMERVSTQQQPRGQQL